MHVTLSFIQKWSKGYRKQDNYTVNTVVEIYSF